MDSPFKSPAILSLCPGMRGLESGIELIIGKVRTLAYVEIEAYIIENLVQQMEKSILDAAPVWSNVKTFREVAHLFRGKVHGITGGYPCQPFSNAGKRGGVEDPRHLYPYIEEIIRIIGPHWCFFENVPGHLSLGYRDVRLSLERLGYKVEEGIFSAEEVGAPHIRKRLFILAMDDSAIRRYRAEKDEICARRNPAFNAGEFIPNAERQRLEIGEVESNGNEQPAFKRVCGELADPYLWWQQRGDYTGMGWNEKPFPFPARPGEPQRWYEPCRTLESRMGYVINGYSYREDLLRMAGNAVVPQSAALAFYTLLNKHYEKATQQ